jgi:tRNA threonylcarbamoyladenosine biosynthesis protein TsaE
MPNLPIIISCSEEETQRLGRRLAGLFNPGDTIALTGELGAGKTSFVKGVASQLGYKGVVTSPTFTIVHEYPTDVLLYHIDCFRLRSQSEIESIGLEEYLVGGNIVLMEWAELISDHFSAWSWELKFDFAEDSDNSRLIHIIRFNDFDSRDILDLLNQFQVLTS